MADESPFLRLAQPGYDVHTAGDENLIYDSRWPLLKTVKQGSFKTGDATQTSVIFDHNLGYSPFFWYFANTPITSWSGSTVGIEERSEFMGAIGGSIEATDKQLKFVGGSATGAAQLYYYVFALDLAKPYTAPIIKTGAVIGQRGNDDRVFKIAKENKDIKSKDLFDYVIHSKARSPLIHSVTPSKGAVKELTVDHNLSYVPMFFGFQKTSTGYTNIYTGSGGSTIFKGSDTQVSFTSGSALEVSIVILKDPFDISYSVRASV